MAVNPNKEDLINFLLLVRFFSLINRFNNTNGNFFHVITIFRSQPIAKLVTFYFDLAGIVSLIAHLHFRRVWF